ncbi:sporulation inhibitor of replication protein SirA [Halobacillus sp. A1]|uniref:Sporulation inhibitor of replication protein SirA n=1 Tax=Halobacillus campisalis TaxID=435909 RepID=A0ABW2K1L1_9BACI|nr:MULTISPECIES: sporulation inhibitor of replication protein SirA [Halobacillus]MCP3031288.1 sporulation inhibitor of replication protein SirA [Halobacillus sp. A1]
MKFAIYAIKRDVTEKYYYKVDLLKRFFEECWTFSDSSIYKKQLDYITNHFSFYEWLKKIQGNHSILSDRIYDCEMNYDIIEGKNCCCLFQCDSLWQAERVLFQPLRMCNQTFFIIEESGEHYGWISPLLSQRLLS